jgi:tetratricopeptide (TPR) repeat protein
VDVKRYVLVAVVCLSLLGCTATPTATSLPELPVALPSTDLMPTTQALPTGTLPATWTPAVAATLLPTWTRSPLATAGATEASSMGTWSASTIPSVTLTPTPADAVPAAALRAYAGAQSALSSGDHDHALALVTEALALVPPHSDFLMLRGQILIARQHPLQGEADLRAALSYDPFHAGARWALADLYCQYGRWRDAEAEFERYLSLTPTDLDGWYSLGTARQAQGQALSAILAYSQTLSLDPDHAEALRRRGELWLAVENYGAAWSDVTALLALSPSADLYQTRARISRHLGSSLLAAADFRSAISLTLPTGAPTETLMIDLGRAYLEAGSADRAAAVFSATLLLTDTVEVRVLLGESHLATGAYTDALQAFADALLLAEPTEKAAVLIGQGRAYLAASDYRSAEAVLGSALDFATSLHERATILRWRSRSYVGLEAYEKALADLAAAQELDPGPLNRYWRGTVYHAAGQVTRAVEELVAFLQQADPDEIDPAVIADAEARLGTLSASP